MNSIKSFFQELFYSIPTLGVMDIVDILVVAFIIYKVMLLIRSTSTARVARSILLLLVMTWLTDVVHMYALNWILTKIIEVGVIALVIVFQPELRSALESLGNRGFFGTWRKSKKERGDTQRSIDEVVAAVRILARDHTGALIVCENQTGLKNIARSGIRLDSRISWELLVNLFTVNRPLHDGAVLISF